MDLVTQSCLKEFLITNELQSESESKDFERFAAFCVVSKEYPATFEVEDVLPDDGTRGIDGIAIIVNGRLVDDTVEIEDLVAKNGFLDVTFVFVQAKTSPRFEGSEIGNFAFSVKEFFSQATKSFPGPRMQAFLSMKAFIYDHASKMRNGSPICRMHYVTTGTWTNDAGLQSLIDRNVEEIRGTNLFREVSLDPCDARTIQAYYRRTKDKVSATFLFEKRVTLPAIEGVDEAYFGMVPFKEFLKLVADETGNMKGIFYDNIRDFLGSDANPVNQRIASTLKSGHPDIFAALNNGITLVADDLHTTGDTCTLTDYQIVNGCQTSHVLFENRQATGIEKVSIPIRLIVTKSDEIKNQITKATNSQTAVKPEQLEALSQFQKDLEQFYSSIEGDGRLYYERRTNQYGNDANVPRAKIISIPIQIKAFSAMFLEAPHLVSGYYGTIAKQLGDKIFKEGHKCYPYYTSGLAFYRLESLFRARSMATEYKKTRYHLLMLCRLISKPRALPFMNSAEMDKYCVEFLRILNDPTQFAVLASQALELVRGSGIATDDKSQWKQQATTVALIEACRRKYPGGR